MQGRKRRVIWVIVLVSFSLLRMELSHSATTSQAVLSESAAVPVPIAWAKTYGGRGDEYAHAVAPTSDGGYIVAATSTSFGTGTEDAWLFRLDVGGNLIWQNTYDSYTPHAVLQTKDGGYITAGYTNLPGAGKPEAWVLKLNGDGTTAWARTYGGAMADFAYSIAETSDGGYILAGNTASFGPGDYDAWVLKLDATGAILWSKVLGGSVADIANSVVPINDAGGNTVGYLVAGESDSFGGAWVLRLDSLGNVVWQKVYGGYRAFSIAPSQDGGYAIGAEINLGSQKGTQAWVFKINSQGTVQWSNTYADLFVYSLAFTPDGGYVASGNSSIFKLDGVGGVRWQKSYELIGASSVLPISSPNAGYIAASSNGHHGAGSTDAWILKLDMNGNIGDSCALVTNLSGPGGPLQSVPLVTSANIASPTITATTINSFASTTAAQVATQCEFFGYRHLYPVILQGQAP